MTRQEINRLILELISKQIEEYPDLRFNQILLNIKINKEKLDPESLTIVGLEDLYHEESSVTLERVQSELIRINALKNNLL